MHPAVVTKYRATFRSKSRFHRYGRNIFQCVFSESDEVNKSRRAAQWSAITILPYFPGFTFPSHQHFSVSSVKSILAILFQITADISFTKCTRNYWPFPFPSILTPKFLRFHIYNILISACTTSSGASLRCSYQRLDHEYQISKAKFFCQWLDFDSHYDHWKNIGFPFQQCQG